MFTGVTAALTVLSGGLTWGLWKGLRSIWFSAFVLDFVAALALIQDIYQDKYSRQFHDFAVAFAFASLTVLLAAPFVTRYYLHRSATTTPSG